MKTAGIIGICLIVLWSLLALGQLWFQLISGELFLKISLTFVLIGVASVLIALIRRGYTEDQQMKRDRYID
ncbi:MAG: hypothetical protein KDA79_22945 [Planctomycetaceae bacterium]|nr:hypothetical protein [Planctomycetaceae bacterium]